MNEFFFFRLAFYLSFGTYKITLMKHLFLLAISLIALPAISQQFAAETKARPAQIEHTTHIQNGTDRALPFWEEDFAGGFPADWATIDSSGICPWTYSTDGSWGFWSNTGETSADPGMNSTTGGNGFLICDTDSANHVNYGQPSGDTYSYLSTYFGTSSIDCSAHSSVVLKFEQYYEINNSIPMFVQVSTDSISWTTFDVSGTLPNNTYSANPVEEVLNISTIAANETDVYLRFGWSCRVYFWMIDDISLSEEDANDVALEDTYWGAGTFNAQYYKVPQSQWSPITFYGVLNNFTGSAMTDAYFDVDVDNSGNVFSGTSNLLSLATAETDTTASSTLWTPSSVGINNMTFTAGVTAQVDANLTNNDFTNSMETTSSLYGLDNLPSDGTGYSGGIYNWSGNLGLAFGIGNSYEIIADDEIQCIEIGLTDRAANEGNLIYGAVYYYETGTGWLYLGNTDDHVVTAADLGSVINLSLAFAVPVYVGQEILVMACHYGGTDTEFMMAQGTPEGMVNGFNGIGDFFYLTSPTALVVRANFSCGLSTDNLDNETSISYYPNPASNLVNIELGLLEQSSVKVNVLDINGRIVSLGKSQEMTSGQQKVVVNTESLSTGIYQLEIHVNGVTYIEKLIVE
jgi:hypothetical protein